MSGLLAMEAEFLLDAASAFFWGELRDFDGVDDHGVGVMGFGIRGVGEEVVGLVGGFRIPLGDVIHSFPLGLEGDGLFIPVVDGGGDSVHGHDATHQRGWDSCREISDQDVGVRDICKGYMVFEGGDILRQRGRIRVVFRILLHTLGRQPGDGVPGDVMVFERGIELCDKVSESSEDERGARDAALAKGRGPGEGRPFGHVGESEGDLFVVSIIDRFVHEEIKLHSVQPVLRFVVGSVERFGNADA